MSLPCVFCEKRVVRKKPSNGVPLDATCFNCGASHTITKCDDDASNFSPNFVDLRCVHESCDGISQVGKQDVKLGISWHCDQCGKENLIVPVAIAVGLQKSPETHVIGLELTLFTAPSPPPRPPARPGRRPS